MYRRYIYIRANNQPLRSHPTIAINCRNTETSHRNSRNNRMIRPAPMAARSSTSTAFDSHASLAVSMEDFEAHEFSPTVPDLPSQHSIYQRSGASSYISTASSNRRSASPPAWRKAGSGWFKHQGSLSPSRRGYHSREGSLEYRSADEEADREEGEGEITVYPLPSRIPLPESPTKGRSPSPSPVPYFGGGESTAPAVRTPAVNQRPSTPSQHDANESEAPDQKTPTQVNCKFQCVVSCRRHLPFPSPSAFPFRLFVNLSPNYGALARHPLLDVARRDPTDGTHRCRRIMGAESHTKRHQVTA